MDLHDKGESKMDILSKISNKFSNKIFIIITLFLLLLLCFKNTLIQRKYSSKFIFNETLESPRRIYFEKNIGQLNETIDFYYRALNDFYILTPSGLILNSKKIKGKNYRQIIEMKWVGANPKPACKTMKRLQSRSNYLIGNDPNQWLRDIPHYQEVMYQSIWPGIDLVYHGRNQNIEFDFLISPKADPDQIRLQFSSGYPVKISPKGDLCIQINGEKVIYKRPEAWQETENLKEPVQVAYTVTGENQVGFDIGFYDAGRALVVDPQIIFSKYLSDRGGNQGSDVKVDDSGNIYITGTTNDIKFPTTNDDLTPNVFGGSHVFVTKMTPDGESLIYSTYFGGSGADSPCGLAVDTAGHVVVAGYTDSDNYPTANAFQSEFKDDVIAHAGTGKDGFVTRLNPEGNQFVFSTYMGGTYHDQVHDVVVDSAGNAYVTGETQSTEFPVKNALHPNMYNDHEEEAFVAKIAFEGELIWSTYIGGGQSKGYGIAIDRQKNLYITGECAALYYPVTENAYQGPLGTLSTAFVTKMNNQGTHMLFNSHLAGNSRGNAIAIDGSEAVCVTGRTSLEDFPTVNAFQTNKSTWYDGFVSKLSQEGSSLLFSSYLGGNSADYPKDIALSRDGSMYISGYTQSTDFWTIKSFQNTLSGNNDAFYTRINAAGSLDFSTYLGGSHWEGGSDAHISIDIGPDGYLYATGYTSSQDFPFDQAPDDAEDGLVSHAYVLKMQIDEKSELSVTPDPIVFPLTMPGEIAHETVEVTNPGSQDIDIFDIAVGPENLFTLEDEPEVTVESPLTMEPGDKVDFKVIYSPEGFAKPPDLGKSTGSEVVSGVLTILNTGDLKSAYFVDIETAEGLIVNDTRDNPDYDLNDGIYDAFENEEGIQTTLRAAIQNVNALQDENVTMVYIHLPASSDRTIQPLHELPRILYPIRFEIPQGENPVILDGSQAGDVDGLTLESGHCFLKNMIISNWKGQGLKIIGGEYNYIEQCTITNNSLQQTGMKAGLYIDESVSNRIRDNQIYSNQGYGIYITGTTSDLNVIENNRIGFNYLGSPGPYKQHVGVYVMNGSENQIRNNEIGMNRFGIVVEANPTSSGEAHENRVVSNYVGSSDTGLENFGNSATGILIKGTLKTIIEDNLITWNGNSKLTDFGGITINGFANETRVRNNLIGLDATGKAKAIGLGNFGYGIRVVGGAENTRISRNVISGNMYDGILLGLERSLWTPSHHTTIDSNIIGLDQGGKFPLANGYSGISIVDKSYSNVIECNTISANNVDGITVSFGGSGNDILDNRIGTDTTGTHTAGNNRNGILVAGTPGILIMGNLISGNEKTQIQLAYMSGIYNYVMNNTIGPAIQGDVALSNEAEFTNIGISLNKSHVLIEGNRIAFNKIGVDCYNQSSGEILTTFFYENLLAIKVWDSPITIANNAIWDNHRGIDVYDSQLKDLIIAGNEIFDNTSAGSGIHLIDSYADIFANNITRDAGHAIINEGNGSPIIQDNSIIDNAGMGLYHTGTVASLNAQHNWWGSETGPGGSGPGSGEEVSANIDYSKWRTEQIDLLVYNKRDTVHLRSGMVDWTSIYFRNWVSQDDHVSFTVHADKDWLEPQNEEFVDLHRWLGGRDDILFSIPAGTPVGASANVEVRAQSVLNPAYQDTAHFVAVVASQEANQIILTPDTAIVYSGETVKFAATGLNDFHVAFIDVEWECTGGTIDQQGVFKAGDEPGTFMVRATDKISGIISDAVVVIEEGTFVENGSTQVPKEFTLYQNYPNPFNPVTTIKFALPVSRFVTIQVFNITGQEIVTLLDGYQTAGEHAINWIPKGFPSGIYFYRLQAGEFSETKKLILQK